MFEFSGPGMMQHISLWNYTYIQLKNTWFIIFGWCWKYSVEKKPSTRYSTRIVQKITSGSKKPFTFIKDRSKNGLVFKSKKVSGVFRRKGTSTSLFKSLVKKKGFGICTNFLLFQDRIIKYLQVFFSCFSSFTIAICRGPSSYELTNEDEESLGR